MFLFYFRNAKKCNAVDFCIKAVWESHDTKIDSSTICEGCKSWVGEARSLIEKGDKSGDVVKNLRWTCNFLSLPAFVDLCKTAIDESVPAILKMLTSAMDPNQICSALFFCNNIEYKQALMDEPSQKLLPFTCGQCKHVGGVIEKKFAQAEQDDVLENMLEMCGEMSSFSDSCSSIVISNFDDIYTGLSKNIKADAICKTSASCPGLRRTGIVDIIPSLEDESSNIACQLCQQLALHLGEVLIVNTTELEFKNILVGFCHQMGGFSDQCVTLADEYYQTVYNSLVNNLNASKMCDSIGLCSAQLTHRKLQLPTMPLVSSDAFSTPIKTLADSSLALVKNGAWCTSCNYFVHFMQEALRKQSNEDKIEDLMKKVCEKFPVKVQSECKAIIDLYGDTMMSFFDQAMDPRLICPKLKLCPPNLQFDFLAQTAVGSKPTCPFCLSAVKDTREMIEGNKTRKNIEHVISQLCNQVTGNLLNQCKRFSKKYSEEVVEMLLADFTPEEACSFIKLCDAQETPEPNEDFEDEKLNEVITNPQCELCKEIIKIVEQRVINSKSKDEVRRELESVCGRLKKFTSECVQFVDKFSDRIVDLVEKEMKPEELCKDLMFCVAENDVESQDYDFGTDILKMAAKQPAPEISEEPQCVLCEFIMTKLQSELNDTTVDANIKNTLRNICSKLPSTVGKQCTQFIDYNFDMIIVLIGIMKPENMCGHLYLCSVQQSDAEIMSRSQEVENIQHDVFKCAICKGLVDSIDTIVEDPSADTNLMNFEEKVCQKFAGKFKARVSKVD